MQRNRQNEKSIKNQNKNRLSDLKDVNVTVNIGNQEIIDESNYEEIQQEIPKVDEKKIKEDEINNDKKTKEQEDLIQKLKNKINEFNKKKEIVMSRNIDIPNNIFDLPDISLNSNDEILQFISIINNKISVLDGLITQPTKMPTTQAPFISPFSSTRSPFPFGVPAFPRQFQFGTPSISRTFIPPQPPQPQDETGETQEIPAEPEVTPLEPEDVTGETDKRPAEPEVTPLEPDDEIPNEPQVTPLEPDDETGDFDEMPEEPPPYEPPEELPDYEPPTDDNRLMVNQARLNAIQNRLRDLQAYKRDAFLPPQNRGESALNAYNRLINPIDVLIQGLEELAPSIRNNLEYNEERYSALINQKILRDLAVDFASALALRQLVPSNIDMNQIINAISPFGQVYLLQSTDGTNRYYLAYVNNNQFLNDTEPFTINGYRYTQSDFPTSNNIPSPQEQQPQQPLPELPPGQPIEVGGGGFFSSWLDDL